MHHEQQITKGSSTSITRRKFLVGIVEVGCGVIASSTMHAYTTQSLISGKTSVLFDQSQLNVPSASEYIQDGLVAIWDGIENVSFGVHDSNVTSWIDLIGNRTIDVSQCTFSKDELFMPRNIQITGSCDALSSLCTVELVMRCDAPKQNIIRFNSGSIAFRQTGWNADASKIYFFTCSSATSRGGYQTSILFDLTKKFSISLGSGNIMHYNGESYSGSHLWNGSISQTGDFYFDSSSDTSNTGLYISCLRIYNRSISSDEAAYNYYIDQLRFFNK